MADQALLDEFLQAPNGVFVRKACLLWEQWTGRELELPPGSTVSARYSPMFEPDRYATGTSHRHGKWRIDFNGLGDLAFCPVVRLTPAIQALIAQDTLAQAREFAKRATNAMLDRALAWAYLSETEGSFAIEGEVPSTKKSATFARLLQHAGEPRRLTEDGLVDLQNAALSQPLDMAVAFRQEQNRLQGPGRGALGVTYVPPPPDLCNELMAHWMEVANAPAEGLAPLLHAAVVSFTFVFLHPFMDGNGRLSRFLLHHCLGQSGQLPPGFLLPISVAMKRHEAAYLKTLTSFSRPARELCQVAWLDGQDFTYDWAPDAALAFRYMDVTPGAEFTLRMAQDALNHDLLQEAQFLSDFDAVQRSIDARFDLRSSDAATLILNAFEQNGRVSNHRRKQYGHRVQPEVLDAIEVAVQQRLAARSTRNDA